MIGGDFGLDQSDVSILNPIYNHPQQITMGSFIQSKYSIGSGWTIGTGLRYDYRQVIPGNGYKNRVFQKVTTKANLVYSFKERRTFTLSFSEGFRAPSLSELYLQHTSSYGLTMQGNPSLQPEHVSAFEIMYAHSHSQQFSWSTSIFYNRYQDMIDFIYSLPVLAVNRVRIIGTGGEFQSMWKPIKSISIYSEYAFLQMEDRNGDPILYRSKHRGKLRINLKQGTYNLTSQVQLWSRQKYDDFLSHDYKIINNKIVFPIKELPGQFIVNLSIGKKFKSFQSNLTISNIFNQEYKLIQNYPMPGRTWKVTFTKSF
jgi:outer membrane receptor for ferrienterochelin and colicins